MDEIKISIGIIVLNGEPFTRYCIRSLYPYVFQIVVAEGACYGSRSISSADGHSSDGTLEILRDIKANDDPDNKIIIVTAEDEGHPDGFWPGEKHEQCQAFAKRSTGNYLWQVDIDEFYLANDFIKIKSLLSERRDITCLSFHQFSFWGGFDYCVDSWYFKRHLPEIFRIFKWDKGYEYISHRPPTVINKDGVDVKQIKLLSAKETRKLGLFMYHYSFIFPKQVTEKAQYYKNAEWSLRKEAEWWANDVFMNLSDPYRVFSISWVPSWLYPFRGLHPERITDLMKDIKEGVINIELRKTDDIDRLLKSLSYRCGIKYLKILEPIELYYQNIKRYIKRGLKTLLKSIGQ